MQKQKIISLLPIIAFMALFITVVYAGTGGIRIDPPLPTGTESPASFNIWVQGKDEANDPHILLVITESCYQGLSDIEDVVVSWPTLQSVNIVKPTDWTMETVNSVKVPPGTTSGAGYTVASLKDHLDTTGPIYYAIKPILGEALGKDPVPIGVTCPSSDPKMLVYVLGKSESTEAGGETTLFDMKVPPTIPGFVVPEIPLGTISALATMMGALYTKLRNK